MGFGDKFKELAKQAQEAVAERKEQITGAVDRASVAADQRTGGKYSEKIAKAGQKATGVVEKLAGDTGEAGAPGASDAPGTPGASGVPGEPGEMAPAPEATPEAGTGEHAAGPADPTPPPQFG